MKKFIGIILIIIGSLSLIKLFIDIETITENGVNGFYLLGRLLPITLLIIGLTLIKKKNN